MTHFEWEDANLSAPGHQHLNAAGYRMPGQRTLILHLTRIHHREPSSDWSWGELAQLHEALHGGWAPEGGWNLTPGEVTEIIRASAESDELKQQILTGDPAIIGLAFRDILTTVDDWLDGGDVAPAYKDQPLAQDWARITKVAEEAGEAVSALIGCTGQNPRKGVCGAWDDVLDELADVFCTAAFAIQHCTKDADRTAEILANSLAKAMHRAMEAHR